MIYSKVYRVLLRPNLIFGIPRSWFLIASPSYLIPYNMNLLMIGLLCYGATLFVGYLLAKYVDPNFSDILLEFLMSVRRISLAPKILTDSIQY